LGEGRGERAFGQQLEAQTQARQSDVQHTISKRNARYFEGKGEKLDGWADDLKVGLER